MDTAYLFSLIQESLYLIIVFAVFLILGLWQSRYILVNIILSLYIALLFSLKFPYFSLLSEKLSLHVAIVQMVFFAVITIASIQLFRRHIPGDDFERPFENFGKKLLLAGLATSLVMAYSYHALPITDFIHPGTPIQHLFAQETYFFWWLLAPFIILLFV